MPKNVQIRDVSDETYTVLRTRAATDGLSLAQYLRRELDRMADRPTMAELLERADRRRERLGGGFSRGALMGALEEDRLDKR